MRIVLGYLLAIPYFLWLGPLLSMLTFPLWFPIKWIFGREMAGISGFIAAWMGETAAIIGFIWLSKRFLTEPLAGMLVVPAGLLFWNSVQRVRASSGTHNEATEVGTTWGGVAAFVTGAFIWPGLTTLGNPAWQLGSILAAVLIGLYILSFSRPTKYVGLAGFSPEEEPAGTGETSPPDSKKDPHR